MDAAKKIAKLVNKHSSALGIGPVTARTILEWRTSLKDHLEWLLWSVASNGCANDELAALNAQLEEWGRRRQATA